MSRPVLRVSASPLASWALSPWALSPFAPALLCGLAACGAALGFGGGFVMLLGARIAGGCTSGHGISGMAQLALGSFVAVAAMFAGGILAASLFRRL